MTNLLCGAARRCITPPGELLPNLRGLKNRRFAGVLDDLYVRAMVLGGEAEKVLLLAFDMTTAPCTREILEELSDTLHIPVEQIFFTCTHTHAVPFNAIDLADPESQSPETVAASRAFTGFLREKTMEAAKEAVGAMRPARMGWAWGKSCVNIVRLQEYTYLDENGRPFSVCNPGADPEKPADRTLFALRVEDLRGKPIAFLLNFSMHNVATIWNDFDGTGAMGVSGDIAGQVCRFLEAQEPDSVALWSSGAAGDLNPIMLNEVFLPDPVTGRACESFPSGLGAAQNALKVMSQRHWNDVKNLLRNIRCTQNDGRVFAAEEWSITPGVDCVRHPDAPPEFFTGPEVPAHTVRLHMARIGELTLIGAGAELYSSLGRAMMLAAPKNTVLITHDASALCSSHYVLDDETLLRCERSRGFAAVPGYDEYRCMPGVMEEDLTGHVKNMKEEIERRMSHENL